MEKSKITDLQFQNLLGGPFPDAVPLDSSVIEVIQELDYTREEISYQVEEGERVRASLLISRTNNLSSKCPAIIIWHQHNAEYKLGRSEPVGLAGNPIHHTGVDLVRKGYIVLCPDIVGFESRQRSDYPGSNLERYLQSIYLMKGKCLAWKYLLDARAAINYLASRVEIDQENLGSYGHSLGSTISWMQAVQDSRIKIAVGNCCLVTTDVLEAQVAGHYHSEGHVIPKIEYYDGDAAGAAALIIESGRVLHLNFGKVDPLNPIGPIKKSINYLQGSSGKDNFTYFIDSDAGHTITDKMKAKMFDAFSRFLVCSAED